MKPTHLDLFTGIGGFTLAAERAGFETIGFSEIEPYACKILKKNWPEVPNIGDITHWREWPDIRYVSLITGGFPCQPFSCAGKRRGATDDRFLWPSMLGVIGRYKPDWVLGENVPGLIGMELDRCLTDLEGIGFRTATLVIPACAVDARHRRDRVWILGSNTDWKSGTKQERQHQRPEDNGGSSHDGLDAGSVVAFTNGIEQRQDSMQNGCGVVMGRKKQDERTEGASKTSGCGCILANANEVHVQRIKPRCIDSEERKKQSERQVGSCDYGQWSSWPPEPAVGRVAHGIPNRSHRLKGLGNAIVPQVAEVILRGIYQALT